MAANVGLRTNGFLVEERNALQIMVSGQSHDNYFLTTVPIMHRQHPQSANQNGGAASTKTACNRYGSNLGFKRARSRSFKQKAVSDV